MWSGTSVWVVQIWWCMLAWQQCWTNAGLDVCKSSYSQSYCSTNVIADHCTVSHNVHVAPAGLACLTASVCLEQTYGKSWSRGCFIHWSSYARCLFRRCFLKGVSLKLATVLIVGFISFISFAIITLFELLYFATLIGSWSVMRLHMSAYISLEIRGRCVWQQKALPYCSCPCKAQPESLAEDLYILS